MQQRLRLELQQRLRLELMRQRQELRQRQRLGSRLEQRLRLLLGPRLVQRLVLRLQLELRLRLVPGLRLVLLLEQQIRDVVAVGSSTNQLVDRGYDPKERARRLQLLLGLLLRLRLVLALMEQSLRLEWLSRVVVVGQCVDCEFDPTDGSHCHADYSMHDDCYYYQHQLHRRTENVLQNVRKHLRNNSN